MNVIYTVPKLWFRKLCVVFFWTTLYKMMADIFRNHTLSVS